MRNYLRLWFQSICIIFKILLQLITWLGACCWDLKSFLSDILQPPNWQETLYASHKRYVDTFQAIADMFPHENVLCVTHGNCIVLFFYHNCSHNCNVTFFKNILLVSHVVGILWPCVPWAQAPLIELHNCYLLDGQERACEDWFDQVLKQIELEAENLLWKRSFKDSPTHMFL